MSRFYSADNFKSRTQYKLRNIQSKIIKRVRPYSYRWQPPFNLELTSCTRTSWWVPDYRFALSHSTSIQFSICSCSCKSPSSLMSWLESSFDLWISPALIYCSVGRLPHAWLDTIAVYKLNLFTGLWLLLSSSCSQTARKDIPWSGRIGSPSFLARVDNL